MNECNLLKLDYEYSLYEILYKEGGHRDIGSIFRKMLSHRLGSVIRLNMIVQAAPTKRNFVNGFTVQPGSFSLSSMKLLAPSC